MPGEGAERCQEVEMAGPGPNRKPGRQLQAGRDSGLISSHGAENTALTQTTGVGTWRRGPGGLPHPGQALGTGLGDGE